MVHSRSSLTYIIVLYFAAEVNLQSPIHHNQYCDARGTSDGFSYLQENQEMSHVQLASYCPQCITVLMSLPEETLDSQKRLHLLCQGCRYLQRRRHSSPIESKKSPCELQSLRDVLEFQWQIMGSQN